MEMQIFCFASAGGSVSMYNELKRTLTPALSFEPVELPGRGRRFSEPLKSKMKDVVEDCYQQIVAKTKGTYALLGYSMGAWIAYELYYLLKHRRIQLPCHLFICAQEPPFIEDNTNSELHKLSDERFLERIIDLGGIPEELRSPDILNLFLPILRSDYTIVETYENRKKKDKIDCDVTIIFSDEDSILCKNPNNPFMWKEYVNGKIDFYNLGGGHFFINQNTDIMAKIINQQMGQYQNIQEGVVSDGEYIYLGTGN